MKKLSVLLFILFSLCAFAKDLPERRVYYLDVTGSMAEHKIWSPVKENLKRAIDNISDPDTEIIVIPFTDSQHGLGRVWAGKATRADKDRIKGEIDNVGYERSCSTNLGLPLNDFLNKRMDPSKVNYMFLMTDGIPEQEKNKFLSDIDSWGNRALGNAYGFYVKLHNDARHPMVSQKIKRQNVNRLWEVGDASIDINLIRAKDFPVFNPRNEHSVSIPFSGKFDPKNMKVNLDENPYYKLDSYEVGEGSVRCVFSPKQNLAATPEREIVNLHVTLQNPGEFDCLLTPEVPVTFQNKKERTLKVKIR